MALSRVCFSLFVPINILVCLNLFNYGYSADVCYATSYSSKYQVVSKIRSSQQSYSCGWWGLYRCTRTLYQVYYEFQYIIISYSHAKCCAGTHTGVYPNCRPFCNPTCNNGTCLHNVQSNINYCYCNSGYTGQYCDQDINECTANPSICHSPAVCKNTLGSYICQCPKGYTLGYEQFTCVEITTSYTLKSSTHLPSTFSSSSGSVVTLIPTVTPGSCKDLNLEYSGCCKTYLTRNCDTKNCHCDKACHSNNDCCSDITDIGCYPSNTEGSCVELKLNYHGCCDLSKSKSCVHIDCHCDQSCHIHNDCCDDIADIGCSPASPSPILTSTPTDTLDTEFQTPSLLISTTDLPEFFLSSLSGSIVFPTPTDELGFITPYPLTSGSIITPKPTPKGLCLALNLNYSGCCVFSLSPPCTDNECFCDQMCYTFNDCCNDIADIGCHPASFNSPILSHTPINTPIVTSGFITLYSLTSSTHSLLAFLTSSSSSIITPKPTPKGSCLALNLNYSGCCLFSLSPPCTDNGCYCDQNCYLWNDCCNDIANIGCSPASHFPILTSTPTDTLEFQTPSLLISTTDLPEFLSSLSGSIVFPTPTDELGFITPYLLTSSTHSLLASSTSSSGSIITPKPTPKGSCLALNLNYSGCCVFSLSPPCSNNGCYCDQYCFLWNDCCSDITDIGCHPTF